MTQKCLEDGMFVKDEEREPLQPDGNNKDVKVTTFKKWKFQGKGKCEREKDILSPGDKWTDRGLDKAGLGRWENPAHPDAQQQQGAEAWGENDYKQIQMIRGTKLQTNTNKRWLRLQINTNDKGNKITKKYKQ